MKALVYTAPFTLELQDVPTPRPGPDEVLVRVKAVGICGSDVHGYAGTTGRRCPPLVMGHEAAGIVASPGSGVRGITNGTPVCFDSTIYCNTCTACQNRQYNRCFRRSVPGVGIKGMKRQGAMAEYILLPARVLKKMPNTLSFVEAALVEPVSIGLHAVARGGGLRDNAVFIIGAGTIGLCTLLAARLSTPRVIIVSDLREDRLALARSLGADVAVKPDQSRAAVHELTQGVGADVTFEVVGLPGTIDAAIGATRIGGYVVLVGNATRMPSMDVQKVVSNELTLRGSYASAGEYVDALHLVASGAIDPSPLVSGIFPLEQGAACFERLHRAEEDLVKIVLTP